MVLSAGLLLLSSVLIVPGVIGVVRSLGGRAVWLGRAAQTFALLGAIGHGALAGVYLMWASIPGGEASRAQLIDVIDWMNNSPSLVMILPLFIAFPVALLSTYGAAVRARTAPKMGAGRGRRGPRARDRAPRLGSVLDLGRAGLPDRRRRRPARRASGSRSAASGDGLLTASAA